LCVLAAALLAGCGSPSGSPLVGGGGGFTWTGIDAEDFGVFTTSGITRFQVANAPQWNAALAAIQGGGNNANYVITLTGNFALDGISYLTFSFGSVTGLTVSLRGVKTIALDPAGAKGSLLHLGAGQRLILRDSTLKGRGDNDVSLVWVEGGSLFMKAGSKIQDNASSYGGGVAVNVGSFTMEGGEISGNSANYGGGGGVYLMSSISSFTMKGGKISDNSANYGGGVYTWGSFTMEDGEISGNSASGSGTEGIGGGVCVIDKGFTMKGGKISGNTASWNGGGVYVYLGTFFGKTGGIIYGDSPAATTTPQTAGPNANTATSSIRAGQNGHAVMYEEHGGIFFYRNGDLNAGADITTTGVTTGSYTPFEGYW
jgi:hypothetical protein